MDQWMGGWLKNEFLKKTPSPKFGLESQLGTSDLEFVNKLCTRMVALHCGKLPGRYSQNAERYTKYQYARNANKNMSDKMEALKLRNNRLH